MSALKFIKAKNFNKNMPNSKCAVIGDVDSSGEGGELGVKYTHRAIPPFYLPGLSHLEAFLKAWSCRAWGLNVC